MKGLCEFILKDMMKSHSTKYSTVLHETFLYILRSLRATLSEKDDDQLQNRTYQEINGKIDLHKTNVEVLRNSLHTFQQPAYIT